MSDNNQINQVLLNSEEKEWCFLPDTVEVISQYLTKSELLELSKVCKNYRLQLKCVYVNYLTLFNKQFKINKVYKHIPVENGKNGKNGRYDQLINDIKGFLVGYGNSVKEISICSYLSRYLIKNLFEFFTGLETVNLYAYNSTILSEISKLEHLKHLKIYLRFDNLEQLELDLLLNLFKRMETISIDGYSRMDLCSINTLKIDSSFINLTKLSLDCINTFASFPIHLPCLVDVSFFEYFYFNGNYYDKFIEFFNINPQLKRLDIPKSYLNEDIIQSIFNLNSLKYLRINDSGNPQILRTLNGAENRSIEQLEITQWYTGEDYSEIINCCINLKVVKICHLVQGYGSETPFNVNQVINLLIINEDLKKRPYSSPSMSLLNCFSKVRLINWEPFCAFKSRSRILKGWKFSGDYPEKSKNYCLIRE